MGKVLDAESIARLKLHLIPGIGPRTTQALLERFESAERILQTPPGELATVPHIGEKTARQLAEAFATVNVEKELDLLERHQTQLIHRDDPAYPKALREIVTAPHMMY